ncbi:hypothetical protein SPSYN_01510 [Sporotomaculum syntrophicum]|uniref:Endonuclease/exonuclease/phosphatase domain-containing protein n=1 Tax=Sporotomaculum syntrophicum TaxID=182264 RepID=A0A9D2WQ40_9FIRM|nr:endonuclease/exonuclease/phosphatase family protein [Sporotomaculum syntrophicum]KAF1085374.1 hypothetical protein SPSYN_01510 [Sporotomaculum syntrophicum]
MRLRILSYNIRHCRGMNGKVCLKAVASTIAGAQPDLVGLQEVDYFNPRSAFADQAAKLGRMLGMYHVYGPNVTWGGVARFGNAVLSRYPIVRWHNYLLPSKGEQRGLLRAEIQLNDLSVVFFNTHLGLDHQERLQQVAKIQDIVRSMFGHQLLAGDLNANPDSKEIAILQTVLRSGDLSGTKFTFPSNYPKYKIDYIFYSDHWRLIETKVYTSRASDHLPLSADVQLDRLH